MKLADPCTTNGEQPQHGTSSITRNVVHRLGRSMRLNDWVQNCPLPRTHLDPVSVRLQSGNAFTRWSTLDHFASSGGSTCNRGEINSDLPHLHSSNLSQLPRYTPTGTLDESPVGAVDSAVDHQGENLGSNSSGQIPRLCRFHDR